MDEPCQAGSWWRGGGGCVFSKPVLERRQSAHHGKATPHGRLVRVSKAQLSMRLSIQYPVPTHMSWHWWGWWPTRGPSRETGRRRERHEKGGPTARQSPRVKPPGVGGHRRWKSDQRGHQCRREKTGALRGLEKARRWRWEKNRLSRMGVRPLSAQRCTWPASRQSSNQGRVPRRSINQRHVVSCGDGETGNGRMKGPVGGGELESGEGQSHSIKDGSRDERERCCCRWFARRCGGNSGNHGAFFLGSPPHFCLLFGQGTTWANRGGQCSVTTCPRTAHHERDGRSRGDKPAMAQSRRTSSIPLTFPCLRFGPKAEIVPVQRSRSRPTTCPMSLSGRVERKRHRGRT